MVLLFAVGSAQLAVVEIQLVLVVVGPVAAQTAELGTAVAPGLLQDLLAKVALTSPLALPVKVFLTAPFAAAAEA